MESEAWDQPQSLFAPVLCGLGDSLRQSGVARRRKQGEAVGTWGSSLGRSWTLPLSPTSPQGVPPVPEDTPSNLSPQVFP